MANCRCGGSTDFTNQNTVMTDSVILYSLLLGLAAYGGSNPAIVSLCFSF